MISKTSKILIIAVFAVSLLAIAYAGSDSSDADPAEYRFYLVNSVEGEDSTINGWYTGSGETVVAAFVNALDTANIPYAGFTASDESIYFNNEKTISNWTTGWDSKAADVLGPNYAIWNYNATDGWYSGGAFGSDDDLVYIISHENYYKPTGPTALSLGVSKSTDDLWTAPEGITVPWGSYVQMAPRNLTATPENVVLGPDRSAIKEYTLLINNSVEGQDSSFNGTHTGIGTGPVQALIYALNNAGVSHKLDYSAESVYFKSGDIADWTTAWDSKATDVLGANLAIWNYNAEDGWFIGNSFGMDDDVVYFISHENYYKPTGPTAMSLGASKSTTDVWTAPAGLVVSWGSYMQKAPRDLKATPATVVFGPDMQAIQEYTLIINNSVAGQDSSFNGTYTGVGTTPVQALVYVLNNAGVSHKLNYNAKSVYFATGDISDWTTSWVSDAPDIIGAQFAIWNYNAEDGWFMGNSFGSDDDLVYYFSHEYYYSPYGATAHSLGVDFYTAWGSPADYGLLYDGTTGGYVDALNALTAWYATFEFDDVSEYGISYDGTTGGYGDADTAAMSWMGSYTNKFNLPAGLDASNAQYGYMQYTPRDLKAAPADMVYGPDATAVAEYTLIIDNSIEGQDSSFNGIYAVVAGNPVQALILLLDSQGVTHKLSWTAESVYIKSGDISDWTTSWDSKAEDVLGPNLAIWNYNATDGWFIGNAFGADNDVVYLISHENYYKPTGPTALSLGASKSTTDVWTAPAGLVVSWGSYMQKAPRDLKATPANMVFGPDMQAIQEYTIILNNSVEGENSAFNGTYTGVGTGPVQALIYVLNNAQVAHKLDYSVQSAYFKSGDIADWTTGWDSKAEDVLGPNYAIWNYNATDGWYSGNSFGMDDDVVYLISHELYYVPTGPSSVAMGVTSDGAGGYICPDGLTAPWGSWVQLAPMDLSATPDNVRLEPYYALKFDPAGGQMAVTLYMLKENADVPAIPAPTKDNCTFMNWDGTVPSVMPAKSSSYTAVWAVTPEVKGDEVVVDLKEDDHFVMPDTAGKKLDVEMKNDATVVVTDTSGLQGKVITAKVEAVENPSTIEGVAYDFIFEADNVAVTGRAMQVTFAYNATDGKVPVVYYCNGTSTEQMTVVSYTDTTVTFETTHNSIYVVGLEDKPVVSDDDSVLSHMIFPIAVLVAALGALVVAIRTKVE